MTPFREDLWSLPEWIHTLHCFDALKNKYPQSAPSLDTVGTRHPCPRRIVESPALGSGSPDLPQVDWVGLPALH